MMSPRVAMRGDKYIKGLAVQTDFSAVCNQDQGIAQTTHRHQTNPTPQIDLLIDGKLKAEPQARPVHYLFGHAVAYMRWSRLRWVIADAVRKPPPAHHQCRRWRCLGR